MARFGVVPLFYVIFIISYDSVKAHKHPSKLKVVTAIENGLRVIYENPEDLNVDAYFGIVLAYARMISMNDNSLYDAIEMSEDVLQTMNNNAHTISVGDDIMNAVKWRSLLIRTKPRSICEVNQLTKSNSKHFTETVAGSLLGNRSSPDETSSDDCLSELIRASERRVSELHSCQISEKCSGMMSKNDAVGYSTTHKLLYWLVCRMESCSQCAPKELKTVLDSLSCTLKKEALLIESIYYPKELRDLFMEEVLLCTASGYPGIMKDEWVQKVLEWQRPSGCWGYSSSRMKRSTTSLGPEGCSSHETSVGIAFLVFSLGKY